MSVLLIPWGEESPLLSGDVVGALFLPSSVAAAITLRERGIPTLRLADFVGDRDFHTVWEDVFRATWRSIERASKEALDDGPKLMPIFGYSLALAAAQLRILDCLFDRIHARTPLSELRVELPQETEEDSYVFGDGLGNPFYAAVASNWAERNGIPCQTVPAGKKVDAPATPASAPSSGAPRHGWAKRAAIRIVSPLLHWSHDLRRAAPVQVLEILAAILRRKRVVVFTDRLHRLPPRVGAARTVATLPWGYCFRSGREALSAEAAFERFLASEAWRDFAVFAGPYETFVRERLWRRVQHVWSDGATMFQHAARLARWVRRGGAVPVILADSPFCDFAGGSLGFGAEAFRQNGGKIAEMQHGSNYTTVARGFTPTILTTGLGDLFLEWNDVGCREHQTYGLAFPHMRFATVGCWSTEPVPPPARSASPAGSRVRVLYAPTLLSTVTICGLNALWDDYFDQLDTMLPILDAGNCEVDVSYLPNEEMRHYLSRRTFKNLRFHQASFVRLAPSADVLIGDMLVSSAPLEATVTAKPVILYTGGSRYTVDKKFVADLETRAVVFGDRDDYIAGIRSFAVDPLRFLREHPRTTGPDMMNRYFPSVDGQKVWSSLAQMCAA